MRKEKRMVFRVEFFDIKEIEVKTVDEWTVEDFRYPDLTAADYMECSDYELGEGSNVVVTLFRNDIAVSSVLWFNEDGEERIEVIF